MTKCLHENYNENFRDIKWMKNVEEKLFPSWEREKKTFYAKKKEKKFKFSFSRKKKSFQGWHKKGFFFLNLNLWHLTIVGAFKKLFIPEALIWLVSFLLPSEWQECFVGAKNYSLNKAQNLR